LYAEERLSGGFRSRGKSSRDAAARASVAASRVPKEIRPPAPMRTFTEISRNEVLENGRLRHHVNRNDGRRRVSIYASTTGLA